MNLLNIHVSNVNIRQHDRTSLRLTNNINIKVLNVHVTNVNIMQQHKDFLRLTNNLNMKVLNIPVPDVNIKVSYKLIFISYTIITQSTIKVKEIQQGLINCSWYKVFIMT